jgi:hypothetical protein
VGNLLWFGDVVSGGDTICEISTETRFPPDVVHNRSAQAISFIVRVRTNYQDLL